MSQGQSNNPPKTNSAPSLISADLKIRGDVESAGDVQIDGLIEGDVTSRSLTLGQGAHVKGSIYADMATIAGTISGQINAKNVTIAKSARVQGDVIHETLSIEAGAYLEGRFMRMESMRNSPKKGVNDTSASNTSTAKPAPIPSGGLTANATPASNSDGISAKPAVR